MGNRAEGGLRKNEFDADFIVCSAQALRLWGSVLVLGVEGNIGVVKVVTVEVDTMKSEKLLQAPILFQYPSFFGYDGVEGFSKPEVV